MNEKDETCTDACFKDHEKALNDVLSCLGYSSKDDNVEKLSAVGRMIKYGRL